MLTWRSRRKQRMAAPRQHLEEMRPPKRPQSTKITNLHHLLTHRANRPRQKWVYRRWAPVTKTTQVWIQSLRRHRRLEAAMGIPPDPEHRGSTVLSAKTKKNIFRTQGTNRRDNLTLLLVLPPHQGHP